MGSRLLLLTALLTSLLWLTVGGLLLFQWRQPKPVTFQIAPPPATTTPLPTPTATATPTSAPVLIDIDGAVRAPGVYQLPPGSRVQDALAAAGGLAADADPHAISLAQVLTDGEKVHVPATGETSLAPARAAAVASRFASAASDQMAASNASPSAIDLNTATLEALDTLPGIGPKTAQAILDYRQANGRFSSVDDLLNVKGIGEATLAKIRDLVTVGEAP